MINNPKIPVDKQIYKWIESLVGTSNVNEVQKTYAKFINFISINLIKKLKDSGKIIPAQNMNQEEFTILISQSLKQTTLKSLFSEFQNIYSKI